jgi:uncharacterized protein YndB with AHSA1/START domain
VTGDGPADVPIEIEVRVAARPETVFTFFTDPQRYVRWQGARADLDPQPGGRYRVEMDDGSVVIGEYVEIEPPRRLVFTWGWEGNQEVPPGSSTVEVTLEPDGDATLVHLRHSGLPTDDWRHVHSDGWDMFLARLRDSARSE